MYCVLWCGGGGLHRWGNGGESEALLLFSDMAHWFPRRQDPRLLVITGRDHYKAEPGHPDLHRSPTMGLPLPIFTVSLKGNTGRVMYLGRGKWWGWRTGKIWGRGNWSRWNVWKKNSKERCEHAVLKTPRTKQCLYTLLRLLNNKFIRCSNFFHFIFKTGFLPSLGRPNYPGTHSMHQAGP